MVTSWSKYCSNGDENENAIAPTNYIILSFRTPVENGRNVRTLDEDFTFWDLDGRGASDLVDNGSGGETEHISI